MNNKAKMTGSIYVTEPTIPPLDEFIPYLRKIWERNILTNNGPYHQELEKALCEHLKVQYISLFSNGTIALIVALQALEVRGEVITTPYSFVATAHALLWNKITPVFVDIEPSTLNIDPGLIEAAISPSTTAILPVHCYGNACEVDKIAAIAAKHEIKVIYDAAHAFGVRCSDNSLLNYGDLSVLSFHATKVFNTFEGGAIVSKTPEMKRRIDQLKNFGIVDETTVVEAGINGKMSEINAAFGVLQLKYIDAAIRARQIVDSRYRNGLKDIDGITCICTKAGWRPNFSYFPILIDNRLRLSRDELYEALRRQNIFCRRYFYPLISEFPMYTRFESAKRQYLPVAADAAARVLCLPMASSLDVIAQDTVIKAIKGCLS